MSAREQKWGYKGTETAINGLVNWILRKTDYAGHGLWNDKMERCYKLIVRYGQKNYPELKLQGHARTKADKIAKFVQKDNKFQHFVHFVLAEVKFIKQLETQPLMMITDAPGIGKTATILEMVAEGKLLQPELNSPNIMLLDELEKSSTPDLKRFLF